MRNRKILYITALVFGICLVACGFLLKGEELKAVSGVCIGIGACLFGLNIGNLFTLRFEKKNPELARIKEIEGKDERNIIIRNRAKAKAADITQYLIILLTFVTILIRAPLWVTFITIGVYLSYNILWFYFISKFNREM
jgi:hypothetical protein